MLEKVRFAVIGASDMAPAHIEAICSNPCAQVDFIHSRDINRAGKLAKRYNLKASVKYEEILRNQAIDAVDIVTEPDRHASLALEAIKNGKHVLIEKPLDIDISLAGEAASAAERSGLVSGVISQKRFEPEIIRMREKLLNGAIGDPYLAQVSLIWRRDVDYYKKGSGWRSQYGNVLINQAIHWLDLAIWFFGLPEKTVSLSAKVKQDICCEDTAVCSLRFGEKMLFNLACSTAANRSRPDVFRIFGTKGLLDYSAERRRIFVSKFMRRIGCLLKRPRTPLECQIDDFIHCIMYGGKPRVSLGDGVRALETAHRCISL